MHDEDEPRTMKQTLPADVETKKSRMQYALQALTDGGAASRWVSLASRA